MCLNEAKPVLFLILWMGSIEPSNGWFIACWFVFSACLGGWLFCSIYDIVDLLKNGHNFICWPKWTPWAIVQLKSNSAVLLMNPTMIAFVIRVIQWQTSTMYNNHICVARTMCTEDSLTRLFSFYFFIFSWCDFFTSLINLQRETFLESLPSHGVLSLFNGKWDKISL